MPSTSASVQDHPQLPSTPLALEEEIPCETDYESESENERPLENSEGSNAEESDFDDDAAQNCFDDFMVSLPSLTRKTLSVSLMHYFQTRQGMNVKDSAQEAAYITGFNEKTIRSFRLDFLSHKGHSSDSSRGKYERFCLFNDEGIRLEASMWVRQNAHKKGAANMTAASFCEWVNNELLPSSTLPPFFPRTITVRTATRWLHKLGFQPMSHKKGAYVDGHEREDVVTYRKHYLKELDELRKSHLPPPPCSDEHDTTPHDATELRKSLILIFHDESIFNTNEGQTWIWGTGDRPYIQPKTKGAGIMVSDFITQHHGFLRLTDQQHAIITSWKPNFPKSARVLLEYGGDKEGYWSAEKFMANVKDAADIADFLYPTELHTIVWLFDQSSCHRAFSDTALNVRRMNVRPGGAQPCMRDTVWAGRVQKLVDDMGIPRGMRKVLEERVINTGRMNAADMWVVLSNHEDFRTEKTIVKHFLTDRGHLLYFIPKFHCELNPIERVWGQAKVYIRKYTNFTIQRLREIINPGLDSVSTDVIRKYYRKAAEYERAYREGKQAGREVEEAVKVYKSHRRVFSAQI